MKRITLLLSLVLTILALAACTSPDAASPDTLAPGRCECTVCKSNADLACVNIPLEATTPRVVYNGKTYYFCSDDCKKEFEKNPEKYAHLTAATAASPTPVKTPDPSH